MATDNYRVTIRDGNIVEVHVPGDVLYNYDRVAAIQKQILRQVGHPTCCSGFNFAYKLAEQEFVT